MIPSTATMPPMLYGTAWKKEYTAAYVLEALEAGFRGIDTACQPKHYNEALVGDAIIQSGIDRASLYLQTKFTPIDGQDPLNIPYDKNAPLATQVAESFAVSQKNLKTNYVDSLLLHSPLFPFARLMQVWRSMEEIHTQGGAKQIGISNCYELAVLKRLYQEAEIKPTILQNRFYAQSDYDREIRLWCQSHAIRYQSFWSLTANPHILNSDTLLKLSIKYRKSTPQILFAYLHAQGITPLSGTTNQEHMLDDLEAVSLTLKAEEIGAISLLL